LEEELQPRLEEAKAGKRHLLFVDASHFVLAAFLGYLWSFVRVFIKSPSGRQNSIILLMTQLLERYADSTIALVMDNAMYQRCKIVMEFAKEHGIELHFLPPYSPNLNLIERLWKFIKKKCLYCKYYAGKKQQRKAPILEP